MSYSTEANAGFRLTTTSGLLTALGKLWILIEKIVNREVIQADANNTPIARPIDEVDARVTIESLDTTLPIAETTSAANITVNFSEAGGGSGSVAIGTMLACGSQHSMRRRQGGFAHQQTYEFQGSSLTYNLAA